MHLPGRFLPLLILAAASLSAHGQSDSLDNNRTQRLETVGDSSNLRTPYHDASPKETRLLAHRLNLSPDQAARIQPIVADRLLRITRVMGDRSLSWKARRQERVALIASTDEQIKPLLTPSQLQQFLAMEGHHPFAAPGPPPPSVSWEPANQAPQR